MRCEVVAIGTELLLGIINDTNSTWIGEQLALIGIDSFYQVKVGDNFKRIEAALRIALDRSDAIICCGGLGPTQDDITRNVLAHIIGAGMKRDEEIAAEIQRRFERRGRTMSANNLRQADVPVGARIIAQMPGTAPGLVCPIGDKVIYAVPGVPREMREMMEGTVLPDLRERAGNCNVIRSRVLRCWGISESGLAEMLNTRISELDRSGTATLAFQASGIEGIKVRIVAKSATKADADAVLDAEEKLIRPIIGDAVFGVDDETMEFSVVQKLRQLSLTLAVIETLTGGMLSARLTTADPEMQVFRGGSVLPIRYAPPDFCGTSPGELAVAIARHACARHQTDVGLSAVMPWPEDGMTNGSVVIGAVIGAREFVHSVVWYPDRERMRSYAVISALDFLRRSLAQE